MKKPKNPLRLRHILDAIKKIGEHTAGFELEDFRGNEMAQDAVVRQLGIVGEAVANLTPDLKASHPQVEWQLATAARNRLIHGYFDVDPDIVWDIVENDLPVLKAQVEMIVKELEK